MLLAQPAGSLAACSHPLCLVGSCGKGALRRPVKDGAINLLRHVF
jgi:hypothetical protein